MRTQQVVFFKEMWDEDLISRCWEKYGKRGFASSIISQPRVNAWSPTLCEFNSNRSCIFDFLFLKKYLFYILHSPVITH
jgi:hypothetical protein